MPKFIKIDWTGS